MPYVKVPEDELVVGRDYVLTHVGCEPAREGATFEESMQPVYAGSQYSIRRVVEQCTRVEAQPTATTTLQNAFKAWKRMQPSYGWAPPKSLPRVNHGVVEAEYRKRAFYAGKNPSGAHIFTQERSFGSKKPVAFIPVNTAATQKPKYYYSGAPAEEPVYLFGLSLGPKGEWIVWSEAGGNNAAAAGNNATRRNNAAGAPRNNAAGAASSGVALGNLLNLNRNKMRNANNATKKARENWYKQHAREQELQGLFGGGRTRRANRRSRRSFW
jgi:hypothetical protein